MGKFVIENLGQKRVLNSRFFNKKMIYLLPAFLCLSSTSFICILVSLNILEENITWKIVALSFLAGPLLGLILAIVFFYVFCHDISIDGNSEYQNTTQEYNWTYVSYLMLLLMILTISVTILIE